MTEEVFEKEISQQESIDEETNKTISNMGAIWKACSDKLLKDNVCKLCGKTLGKNEPFDIIEVPAKKIDKGLFVLASICKPCKQK